MPKFCHSSSSDQMPDMILFFFLKKKSHFCNVISKSWHLIISYIPLLLVKFQASTQLTNLQVKLHNPHANQNSETTSLARASKHQYRGLYIFLITTTNSIKIVALLLCLLFTEQRGTQRRSILLHARRRLWTTVLRGLL